MALNLDDPIDRENHAQLLKDIFTVHHDFGGVFDLHPPLYGAFETDDERHEREKRIRDRAAASLRLTMGY